VESPSAVDHLKGKIEIHLFRPRGKKPGQTKAAIRIDRWLSHEICFEYRDRTYVDIPTPHALKVIHEANGTILPLEIGCTEIT
jgi:hypothetical protein